MPRIKGQSSAKVLHNNHYASWLIDVLQREASLICSNSLGDFDANLGALRPGHLEGKLVIGKQKQIT